jgi:hypothetical protein
VRAAVRDAAVAFKSGDLSCQHRSRWIRSGHRWVNVVLASDCDCPPPPPTLLRFVRAVIAAERAR